MISRQWRGIARTPEAERYVAHLKTETFPQLSQIEGFLKASILRRTVTSGVEFLIVTTWESLDAIRQFAGKDVTQAVVPHKVQEMMVSFDRIVYHYEVVE
jgi:heme-degrading monooxygenase HmoA